MSIIWLWNGNVYILGFGYNLPWFGQIYFITLIKEYYDGTKVTYAELLWHSSRSWLYDIGKLMFAITVIIVIWGVIPSLIERFIQ